MRVRALEHLNARLGFGRRKAGDSSDVIVRTAVPKRAMGVLDCKRSLFRRPAEIGSSHKRNLTGDTRCIRIRPKAADTLDSCAAISNRPRNPLVVSDYLHAIPARRFRITLKQQAISGNWIILCYVLRN